MKKLMALLLLACFYLLNHPFAITAIKPSQKTEIVDLSRNGETQPPALGMLGSPSFRVFTDKDGLPNNTISGLQMDKKGYLWAATMNGLTYYNGQKWNSVDLPDQTTTSYMRSLLIASDGSIWLGTLGSGLFHYKDGKWQIYNKLTGLLPHDKVRAICETISNKGRSVIWVGTEGGLVRLEDQDLQILTTDNSGLPHNDIWAIAASPSTSRSAIWIGTSNGLAGFDDKRWITYNSSNSGLIDNSVTALLEVTDRHQQTQLWVGTNRGLCSMAGGQWVTYDKANGGLPSTNICTLLETKSADGGSIIWAGTTDAGLARYQRGKWDIFHTENSGLPANYIFSMLATGSENGKKSIWLGTYGSGLVRFEDDQWRVFTTKSSGLPHNDVRCITETFDADGHQTIWLGTMGGGLAKFENGHWTTYKTTNSPLPRNAIWSLTSTKSPDGKPIIWVGMFDGELAVIKDGQWTVYNKKNSGLYTNSVYSLLPTLSSDGKPSMLVGTNNGIYRFEQGQFRNEKMQNFGLPDYLIINLAETDDGAGGRTLWAATDGGLAMGENGKWVTFDTTNSHLPTKFVLSFLQYQALDHRSVLWIGTEKGLVWLDLNDRTRTIYGLPAEMSGTIAATERIDSIQQDAEHRLYLFTNKGIVRMTPRSGGLKAGFDTITFTMEDGLPGNPVNNGVGFIDSRGYLWACTPYGLATYKLSSFTEDHVPKPLYFEHTLVNDQEYRKIGDVNSGQSPLNNSSLAFNQNKLVFEFSLVSLFKEKETEFRTHLVGMEDAPSGWTRENKKEYPFLPDGQYKFRVWGKDYAGNISGPIEITFSIMPPPWRSWWAYLIYFTALIGIVYSSQRYRMRLLEERNRMLEVKIAERTHELANALDQVKSTQMETEKKNEELSKALKEVKIKNQELIESHQRADRIFSALAEALPGTVLDGKYRIDEKIGAGGYGAVYRGNHLALKRPIAVKVFKPMPGNDSADGLQRFLLEAVSASRVNHPNAVAVLDSGISAEGIAYLVMELLSGHSLKEELEEKVSFSLARAASILIPVCDVISKAHASGILHRDIKPDNIFLNQTPEGEVVKVVDFGIAKLADDSLSLDNKNLTATGRIVGTPAYMALERFEGKPYDGKSDVYSIGVVLYQMLCGRVPFLPSAAGPLGLMLQLLTTEAPPLSKYRPNIPKEVEDVVLKAISKDPANRPTAKELAIEFVKAANIDNAMLQGINTGQTEIPILEVNNSQIDQNQILKIKEESEPNIVLDDNYKKALQHWRDIDSEDSETNIILDDNSQTELPQLNRPDKFNHK